MDNGQWTVDSVFDREVESWNPWNLGINGILESMESCDGILEFWNPGINGILRWNSGILESALGSSRPVCSK